jgi:two-component system, NtrC family, response regulator HydG
MQKILIIDDDRDMCLLLKRFLSRHGFEVLESYSGKKALELLETIEPDLVMCDFRLEDMEGNVLLGKIKERYPHVPVIIITGYSDIKIAVEVMKMGAYDYITKPLFPDEILVTIKKALETAGTSQSFTPIAKKETPPTNGSTAPETTKEKAPVIVHSGEYIFGDTPTFKNLLQQIDLVGPTIIPLLFTGKAEVVKKPLPRKFTSGVSGKANLLWPSIAERCPKNWPARNCLVMKKVRSRVRSIKK